VSRRSLSISLLACALCAVRLASAQSNDALLRLVVDEGTPLRVALDRRVVIKRTGQPIEAVVVHPIYSYDRVVIPAGTRVLGHVERREAVSKKRRALAMLSGDFTPLHDVLLQFDTIVLTDGRTWPIRTQGSPGTEAVARSVSEDGEKKNKDHTGPGKTERMKETGLRALPYHPEFFSRGTVFNAPLMSALDCGAATPTPTAEAGAWPAPDSVLSARLLVPIDSARATRGTPVEALVTRPVFAASGGLILPAGAKLTGQVTFAKGASHFRRNGQLRFLFDAVHVPGREPAAMLASLYSVEAGRAERLAVDNEGGATVTNSATRFVAPTLGTLALVGLSHGHLDYDTDGAGPEMQYGGAVSGSAAGFIGASTTGLLIASLGHPAAVALGVMGVARTTYAGVFAKGKEVVFPADTPIEVQLAPGPSQAKPAPEPQRERRPKAEPR